MTEQTLKWIRKDDLTDEVYYLVYEETNRIIARVHHSRLSFGNQFEAWAYSKTALGYATEHFLNKEAAMKYAEEEAKKPKISVNQYPIDYDYRWSLPKTKLCPSCKGTCVIQDPNPDPRYTAASIKTCPTCKGSGVKHA